MILNLGTNKITSLLLSLKNVFPSLCMFLIGHSLSQDCVAQFSVRSLLPTQHTLKLILFLTVRTASIITMDAICFCIQELRRCKNY